MRDESKRKMVWQSNFAGAFSGGLAGGMSVRVLECICAAVAGESVEFFLDDGSKRCAVSPYSSQLSKGFVRLFDRFFTGFCAGAGGLGTEEGGTVI